MILLPIYPDSELTINSMKLILSDVKLKIENVRRVRMIKVQNYTTRFKYYFPSGATEIGTYYASHKFFNDLEDFILHVLALPYMAYDCYQLPEDQVSFELEILDYSQVNELATGVFQSFLDFSRNNFLEISLLDVEIGSTYKLKSTGTGQTLFFATPSDYVCIYEEPID